jgi:hypothetical protein
MNTDFTIRGTVYPRVILLQSSTDTLKDVYLEVSRRELQEASHDLPAPRRVGKSGLSSGLTLDFGSMSVQKDARKKGQSGAGSSRK